jgi:hypothetical protein
MPKVSVQPVKKKSSEERKKHQVPWYILKDSRGQGSITVTLMLVSFWVTTIAYLLSLVGKIGDVEFREFDPAAASAYLIPILTLYFGRKWTDSKKEFSEKLPSDTEQ